VSEQQAAIGSQDFGIVSPLTGLSPSAILLEKSREHFNHVMHLKGPSWLASDE